jgi:hypothetical protein
MVAELENFRTCIALWAHDRVLGVGVYSFFFMYDYLLLGGYGSDGLAVVLEPQALQ